MQMINKHKSTTLKKRENKEGEIDFNAFENLTHERHTRP